MLIILPNLKHSFISPVPVLVPVPVPDPDFLVFHTPGQIPEAAVLLYVGYMGMYFCSSKEYGFSIEPLL